MIRLFLHTVLVVLDQPPQSHGQERRIFSEKGIVLLLGLIVFHATWIGVLPCNPLGQTTAQFRQADNHLQSAQRLTNTVVLHLPPASVPELFFVHRDS